VFEAAAFAKIRTADFRRRAIEAWRKLEPGFCGQAVQTLKFTTRSQVFRISNALDVGTCVIAKRRAPDAARRELYLHQQVLPMLDLPLVAVLGSIKESDGCEWIFFEDVGERCYQADDENDRVVLSRWAARLHTAACRLLPTMDLPDSGPGRYWIYLQQSRPILEAGLRDPRIDTNGKASLERLLELFDLLEAGWPHVERNSDGLPRTLVHGDLAPKNLRVHGTGPAAKLIPLDWEAAGWGVPAADLCAIDVDVYCSEARETWPWLECHIVSRIGKIGRVLRWLAAILWAATRLECGALEKAVLDLKCCGEGLENAIEKVKWRLSRSRPTSPRLPPTDELQATLTALSSGNGQRAGIEIIQRYSNPHSSTFPSEIAVCRAPRDQELHIHCKYEDNTLQNVTGYKSGPSYEAAVYQQVLARLAAGVPKFFGSTRDRNGHVWLFTEYVAGAFRLDEVSCPEHALALAAAWAGRFHQANEPRSQSGALSFAARYDIGYYCRWADRSAEFAARWPRQAQILNKACSRARQTFESLAAAPVTLIHGEYTPHNVLLRENEIVCVDWESAAIAAGENDLASLVDGWPDEVVRRCRDEYCAARWPEGTPLKFEARFEAAQLYWNLRWLGDRDWPPSLKLVSRIQRLRAIAERLGWSDGV
jgi:aminoglycoside phosphotransferase (APT) family kinase protein